ncbi:MAG: cobalamin biosynthesis protein CobD [Comamonadaceae bacterium]|nr:MAG: cobalamin biosynthesis protein CobD [Comamonadaceae bacterium]
MGMSVAALWLALAIDALFGEPPVRWHPVVWMGRYLGWAGRHVAPLASAPAQRWKPFFIAAWAWWIGAAIVLMAALVVAALAARLPFVLAGALVAVALKPLLAWRMLHEEVQAVEAALATSLEAGRERLARLVSRDVHALSATEVRESAIESLAENLNDSVVAPLFWFVLFGLPGAALYRYANTADAMWGYPGERNGRDWQWAGKWAARVDDVLSWPPARLTGLLLAMAVWRWPRGLHREARRTPSPNSGWPMATMALLLGVRLGKPGVYMLHAAGRDTAAGDVSRAVGWCSRVVWLAALAATCALAIAH